MAVFCDFDGTLAPIVRHPAEALLPAATRAVLRRLQQLPRVVVGIVSGRSLADLRQRIGLPGLHYIGSHGLEWSAPNGRRRSNVTAVSLACIRKLGKALDARLGDVPGLWVERKSVSVTVHYRNASRRAAEQARRAVTELLQQSSNCARLLQGKKVLELLPPGHGDKGQAVLRLVASMARNGRRPLLIYLGDDTTDESLFRRLGGNDLSIHVGSGPTRARYRLRSPREAARFLRSLAEVLA
ncbi:MAG: trehalose-phosphatase [Acidobacteria bacterium]|nr:trehalose-phosphatase [Acidobacteriota bacterium]